MSEGHEKKKHGGGHGGGGHGGGGAHEEHEGAPEWLISFADFVMLVMGFFVIMFAMNVQPKGGNAGGGGENKEGVAQNTTFIDFAISMREAFHTLDDLDPSNPLDQPLIERMKEKLAGAGDAPDDGAKGRKKNVESIRPGNYVGEAIKITFASRSVTIDEESAVKLAKFAEKTRGMSTVIDVRGHVSQSEADRQPDQAMVLSSDRAFAVARGLAAAGIDWWRIRVLACGDHERLEQYPNDPESDAKNARVEIIVTSDVAPSKTPVQPGGIGEKPAGGAAPNGDVVPSGG